MSKRLICGFPFVHVAALEPERDAHGTVREYSPLAPGGSALSDSPFCRFPFPGDRQVAGVYAVIVDDRAMYIGKTNNLSRRFGPGEYGHIVVPAPGNPQVTNRRVNHGILEAANRGAKIEVWFHQTDRRDDVESTVISRLELPWNREAPASSTLQPMSPGEAARAKWPSAMRGAAAAKAALLSNRQQGEAQFVELLAGYPDDGWVYMKRAEAYEQLGLLREAFADYGIAERLLPFPGRQAEARAGLARTRSTG